MPSTARTANHSTITGPKKRPTSWVPNRWTTNRPVMITAPRGTTRWSSPGAGTARPSIADITEMAGVMTLSP
jgi:hypothetical protein